MAKRIARKVGRRPAVGAPERPSTQRTYRIYNDLLNRLPELASAQALTIGEVVNRALERYIQIRDEEITG